MKSKLHILFSVLFLALPVSGCDALDGFTSLITGEKDKTSGHSVSEDKDDIKCEHTWIAGNVHAPSCLEDGYTEYTCAKCSKDKQDNIVNALGHSFVNGICERCGSEEENIESEIDKYYKDYDLELESADLETELQRMCFEKHKKYVLYSDFNSYCSKKTKGDSYANSIEAVSDGSTKNQWFYTGKEAGGYGTREHVWPCANSDSLWVHDGNNQGVHNVDYSQYVGGGSDLFHVRTVSTSVNTARGNSKFVDFDDPEFEGIRKDVISIGETNGKYQLKLQGFKTTSAGTIEYADKAEPADEMKGDVARILVYVWIHYGRHGYTPEGQVVNKDHIYTYQDMTGGLNLQNVMGYSTLERCCQKLCEWNELDPPSEVEKLRNNTVQGIQGNRNPFVDFPELMNQLFDDYIG